MKKETKSTETKKTLCYEMKEITLPLRANFTDAYYAAEHSTPQKLSLWLECLKIITTMSDEELLKLTDLEIVQISVECLIEVSNKKKLKK